MRLAILGNPEGWHTQQLAAAAVRLGHSCRVVEFRKLTAALTPRERRLALPDFELFDAEAVLIRGIPAGTLDQIVFRMDALHRLQSEGIHIVNPPGAVETCVDKYLATSRLQAAGLAVPRTMVCEGLDEAITAFGDLGGDVVLKPLFGSEGRGILRLDSQALAERVLLTVSRLGEVMYLQEFIRHPGYDFRALVLGDAVLASMRRTSTGDFRTNVAVGGRFEPAELTSEWRQLAVDAVRAVGAQFAGVDLLPDVDGKPLVIEVNSAPGFQAIAQTTSVDIPEAVVRFVAENRR